MRWVNEIFPPRFRLRKLLMTMRLSAISLAGTARTDVAVGTSSDVVMFLTTIAAAPRNGVVVRPSPSAACAALAAFAALAATMSSGVAVVVGRRAGDGVASTFSLPPAGGVGRAAGLGVDARRGRLGGGGGGGAELRAGAAGTGAVEAGAVEAGAADRAAGAAARAAGAATAAGSRAGA